MKKIIFISIGLLLALFLLLQNKQTNNQQMVNDAYPWQITLLPGKKTRVFGIILDKTSLAETNRILNKRPAVGLFESGGELTLEAYYKNVTLGGLTGSFVFTIDLPVEKLEDLKQRSSKQQPTESKSIKYEFNHTVLQEIGKFKVSYLSYIPAVQLDEAMIVKRFGEPDTKLPLKTKEKGFHYLYPGKGLDVIYREEAKEVLQYTQPEDFNLLLEPLKKN